MTVEAILKRKGRDVVFAAPETNTKVAAELMRQKNIAALLVVEGESILGIVTERDIVRAFARDGGALLAKPIRDIMTSKLITGKPEDSVKHVMQIMTTKLAGMVSIGDIVRYRLEDLELERNVLRDAYIAAR
jgi:CBS domain-containing protein